MTNPYVKTYLAIISMIVILTVGGCFFIQANKLLAVAMERCVSDINLLF